MKNIFTDHPHSVGESYIQHLKFALWFGFTLFLTSLACLVHAFFPFLFVNTAGHNVYRIVSLLKSTGRWQSLKAHFREQNDRDIGP